jgi:RNA polymerase sigma factor (TIGR02999 family)
MGYYVDSTFAISIQGRCKKAARSRALIDRNLTEPDAPGGIAAHRAGRSVTLWLRAWGRGEPRALDEVMTHATGELRRIARRLFARERADHTLQPTAVVNELYLRLTKMRSVEWPTRASFFGFAAQAMRRILIDHARGLLTRRRAPPAAARPLPGGWSESQIVELLALDAALAELAVLSPRQARLVELRYFVGLTLEEAAAAVGASIATASREWRAARAWLYQRLQSGVEPRTGS